MQIIKHKFSNKKSQQFFQIKGGLYYLNNTNRILKLYFAGESFWKRLKNSQFVNSKANPKIETCKRNFSLFVDIILAYKG